MSNHYRTLGKIQVFKCRKLEICLSCFFLLNQSEKKYTSINKTIHRDKLNFVFCLSIHPLLEKKE